ncbi:hypothetical protein ACFLVA_01445 [Chloroflexota bacterium]
MGKRIKGIIEWMGGSTTARFGFIGFFIGIILFAIPSTFYFFKEGGIVMPSWVGTALGIFLITILVSAIVCVVYLFWHWGKDGLVDTTQQSLSNIEQRLTSIERSIENLAKIPRGGKTKKKG